MTVQRDGPVAAGVDYSTQSDAAVAHAAWEADRRGLALRLVHGHQLLAAYAAPPVAPMYVDEEVVADAGRRLRALAQTVRAEYPDLEVTTTVKAGSGGAALVDASGSATMLVVGSRGRGGFARLLVGSVASQVAIYAHCPVIVLRQPERRLGPVPEPGPVVVGVDASPHCALTLRFAFTEAALRDVPLIAAYVWTIPEPGNLNAGTEWSADRHRAERQMQEAAERMLAEALAGWQEEFPDVAVKRMTLSSNPTGSSLLQVADELSAGLIVVGSRGHGHFSGLAFGSVSQAVVAHARRPVAVVHPRADGS